MKINYIVHSTSKDNEIGLVSGKYNISLSPKGIQQANDLQIYLHKNASNKWGMIFSSTLARSFHTAEIVFSEKQYTIVQDERLCEIDYGNYTHEDKKKIDLIRSKYVEIAFPEGESYLDVETRIRDFLEQHKQEEMITIISHQAPQLVLEVICNHQTWQSVFKSDWRICNPKIWQPYWKYDYL